jgi:hypothetical protein
MLQRLNFSLDEELLPGDGWNREQLIQQNDRFVAAVEAAFAAGFESRTAAAATVRVGARPLAEEAAIGAVWRWFVDAKFQATAVEVLARVRASYPNIAAEQVRAGLWQRLKASAGALGSELG